MKTLGKTAFWLTLAGGVALAATRLGAKREASLADHVVLITGGSRGLGLLMAEEFARQGARIAICARDTLELDRARQRLEAMGAEVLAIPCDVSRQDQVESMVAEVEERYGRIDVLVNNAGIIQVGPLATMTAQDFEAIMAVNFFGAVYTTLAVLPGMRQRGYGRLVNIDSIGGRVATPHLIPYDAAKFALRGFSEGIRAELAQDGISVTTVLPGLMRTGSPENALFKGRQAAEYTWFAIADSLPLFSMDANRAAERIVQACRRGEAEIVLTLRAKVIGLLHDLAPSFTMGLFSIANRFLPQPDGAGKVAARGMDLVSPLAPSWWTHWTSDAAKRTNQFGGGHVPHPEHAERMGLKPRD
ncbi:putative ketoacyl reductase [compost metagenome]